MVCGHSGMFLMLWCQRVVRRYPQLRKHLNKVQLGQFAAHAPNCSVFACDGAGHIETMVGGACDTVRL